MAAGGEWTSAEDRGLRVGRPRAASALTTNTAHRDTEQVRWLRPHTTQLLFSSDGSAIDGSVVDGTAIRGGSRMSGREEGVLEMDRPIGRYIHYTSSYIPTDMS